MCMHCRHIWTNGFRCESPAPKGRPDLSPQPSPAIDALVTPTHPRYKFISRELDAGFLGPSFSWSLPLKKRAVEL